MHAERYLELGLRLGKHVGGLVDAYYGPAEIKEQVDAEEAIDPAQLAADADALECELSDGWLNFQRLELWVYCDNIAGIALYRKFGFTVEGTCRAYAFRDGRYVDAYMMARLHPAFAPGEQE